MTEPADRSSEVRVQPRRRTNPPDRALVDERVGRLATDALVTRRGSLKILRILSGGLAVGNVAVALGAFTLRTEGADVGLVIPDAVERSQERRVGKECDSMSRFRGSPYN